MMVGMEDTGFRLTGRVSELKEERSGVSVFKVISVNDLRVSLVMPGGKGRLRRDLVGGGGESEEGRRWVMEVREGMRKG